MARETDALAEIGAILALGLQRVLAKQSSEQSAPAGESSLPTSPGQSGDRTGYMTGEHT
jgi:hypothetical protein